MWQCPESNPVRLVQAIGNKSVPNAFGEPHCQADILRLDEVEQQETPSGATTRSLSPSADIFSRRASSVLLAQELDACLALGDSVDDHVVEGTACGRDCDVVFVWDRA